MDGPSSPSAAPAGEPVAAAAPTTEADLMSDPEVEYKLVPAEEITGDDKSAGKQRDNNRRGGRGGRARGSRGRGRGRGGQGGRYGYYQNYGYQVDPEQFKAALVYQLEFYFNDDNLARDPYIRQHMDKEGYVPLGLLASFPRMQSWGVDVMALGAAGQASSSLEVDMVNEKIRKRTGWEKWLFPQRDGTLGVPLYKKPLFVPLSPSSAGAAAAAAAAATVGQPAAPQPAPQAAAPAAHTAPVVSPSHTSQAAPAAGSYAAAAAAPPRARAPAAASAPAPAPAAAAEAPASSPSS